MTASPAFETARRLPVAVLAAGLCWMLAATAEAQPQRMTYSAGAAPRQNGGELPFSGNTYRRPTVSPYINLQQQGFNPMQAQNIYQTQVQPLMQQQQQQIEQMSQRRQMQRLQNQVQQIGRDTSSRQLDESIRPTGHRATYMNYSHFYTP